MIEHGLRVRLVAGAGVVAADHQQVADAGGGGADKIALQSDAVAVAAGDLQDRLQPGLDQQRRRRQRRQMRPGAGAVGDVDGVGQALERGGLGQQLVAVGGNRRRHLGGDDKTPLTQLFLQVHGGHRAESSGPCKRNNGKSCRAARNAASANTGPDMAVAGEIAGRGACSHHRRLPAGGAARGLRRADGGDARAHPPCREKAASGGAADLEPASRSSDRRRLRRDAGDERGQPRRVRSGAALYRRHHRRHDHDERRHLPGAARRRCRHRRKACRSCRCAG